MARIDWAILCDLAFFDRQARLCAMGVVTRFPVPSLPVVIGHVTLVARLVDIRPLEEVDVAVALVAPNGMWTTPTDSQGVVIEMSGEYVLATLRGIPFLEEGVYGFQISLRGQPAVAVNIPVLTVHRAALAEVH